MNKLISLLFLFFITSYMFAPSSAPTPHRQNFRYISNYEKIGFHWINVLQIIFFGLGLTYSFWLLLLHSCYQVHYVSFNTNLTLFKKRKNFIRPQSWFYYLQILLWLLLCDQPEDFIQFFIHNSPHFAFPKHKISKHLARSFFHTSCVYIFADAVLPGTLLLSIFVLQIWCNALSRNTPRWVPFLLILLANDIEFNPGPYLQN